VKKTIILPFFLFISVFAMAQTQQNVDSTSTKLVLDFPILDLPYAYYATNVEENKIANFGVQPTGLGLFKAWQSPSMEQSTQFSNNFRYALFLGTKTLVHHKKSDRGFKKIGKYTLESAINYVGDLFIPFGQVWQHEEFHKAAMTHANFFSNNTLNDWITGRKNVNSGSTKSVNAVLDTNLVIVKAKSNRDLVRISAAGGEGEIYGEEQMQKNNFFNETGFASSISQIFRALSVRGYISACSDKQSSTKTTLDFMKEEGSNQALRDFTGLDFSAWAYDLFNPNKPYSARGLNPNGNGYDRYIYGEKLSIEQYGWLKKQGNLAVLNFVSPMNFFVNSITLKKYADGTTLKGNFALRYYPTAFGNQLGLNLLLKKGKYNLFLNPAINQNYTHNFPSLEAQLIDYPLFNRMNTTVRAMVWSQPENQAFQTANGAIGGLIAAKIHYKIGKSIYPYVNIGYKTQGWVAGDVFLDKNLDFKTGLMVKF
jgi:hypothetical protein